MITRLITWGIYYKDTCNTTTASTSTQQASITDSNYYNACLYGLVALQLTGAILTPFEITTGLYILIIATAVDACLLCATLLADRDSGIDSNDQPKIERTKADKLLQIL